MRLLAPRLFGDEQLSSWRTRMCLETSMPITTLTTQLIGRKWTPGFFQAGHLSQTAEMLGVSAEELLMQHTVFPYATAFTSPDVRAVALRNALSIGPTARGIGAVTQSVSDQVGARRFCRECAKEEHSRTGESYWHRSHNLPGVLVCLEHRCMLSEAGSLRTAGRVSWSYLLPHQVTGTALPTASGNARRFLFKLAELSVELLHEVKTSMRSGGAAGFISPTGYRDELVRRNLLSRDRQIDSTALRQYITHAVAGSLPEKLTRLDPSMAGSKWPHLMMQPGCKIPFIPLKHVIVRTALEVRPAEKVGAGILNYIAESHYVGKHRESIDSACAERVRQAVDAALAEGRKLSVVEAVEQAGCWPVFRHSRADFPLIEAEVRRLRTSVASLRKTSARRIAMVKNRRAS